MSSVTTKPSKLRVKKAIVENIGTPLPCPSSSSSLEKEIDAIHLKKSTLEVFKEFIPMVVGKGGEKEEENKLEKGGNEIEKTIKQIIQFEKQEKKQRRYRARPGRRQTYFKKARPTSRIKKTFRSLHR